MPGANEASAAARLHENVILPYVESLRARGTIVRYLFCTITSVISDKEALILFENGGAAVLRFGMTTPQAGERWRAIAYGLGGEYILDDLAIAYA